MMMLYSPARVVRHAAFCQYRFPNPASSASCLFGRTLETREQKLLSFYIEPSARDENLQYGAVCAREPCLDRRDFPARPWIGGSAKARPPWRSGPRDASRASQGLHGRQSLLVLLSSLRELSLSATGLLTRGPPHGARAQVPSAWRSSLCRGVRA